LAPRAELPGANTVNDLDCQTTLNAGIDTKGLSGALANPRSPDYRQVKQDTPTKELSRRRSARLARKPGPDRGTNSNSKDLNPGQRPRPPQRRHLAVCLGRGDVGYIDQVGRTYTSTALDGRSLGVFADLKSAADAVSAAALQAQPVDAQVRHSKPRNSADRRTCGVEPSGRGDLTLNAKKSGLLTSAQKMHRK
jgi:hypothetical protein